MALATRKITDILSATKWILKRDIRALCTLPDNRETSSELAEKPKRRKFVPAMQYRYEYREFLPDPNPKWRNSLREKMERADMLKRRNQLDIPEFYVGSILAVTISDPHSQGKTNRFVGICIERKGCGLRAEFILRNVVDHQGLEVRYDLYDPTIQSIQVLRLEKRLDEHLLYLRDGLPEYSTFPFDMDPEILPEGTPVPINPIQVKLKPRPWVDRWERQELKGVSNIEELIRPIDRVRRVKHEKPWEKYDLMKEYRKTIPEEDQSEIWNEVYKQLDQLRMTRKKVSRKRILNAPKPQLG